MGTTENLGVVSPIPKGNWLKTTTYQKLNIVRHNFTSYMALKENVGIEPETTSGWREYWMILNKDSASINGVTYLFRTTDDLTDIGKAGYITFILES